MYDAKKTVILFDPFQILAITKIFAEGFLILRGEEKILGTDMRYFEPVYSALAPKGYVVVNKSDCETASGFLSKLSASQVYADFSSLTVQVYNDFLSHSVKLLDGTAYIDDILAVKDDCDIENIARSCEICQNSFVGLIPSIKEGVTELELSARLEYLFKQNGASAPSFETIVAFGENSAVPHHKTGQRRLKGGDVILIDCGCVYNGFMSDMTRTLAFKSASDEFIKTYEIVKKCQYKSIIDIKSGMNGKQADSVARDMLKAYGLDGYFTHSLGHGVGTHIHERPTLSQRSQSVLSDKMVFSIEPGVYFNGKFGIRIEDTVTLENGSVRNFMTLGKELEIIG